MSAGSLFERVACPRCARTAPRWLWLALPGFDTPDLLAARGITVVCCPECHVLGALLPTGGIALAAPAPPCGCDLCADGVGDVLAGEFDAPAGRVA